MKKYTVVFLFLSLFALNSCKDDATSSGGGGIGGGGDITFEISGQGDPNSYTFGFRPSVDTKLSRLIASLPTQNFFDTLTNNNANYVFSKDTTYTLSPYIGVQSQQAWTFTFAGTIVSNNSNYTTSNNFVVP